MKTKNLIMKIIGIIAGAMSFVAMALPFLALQNTVKVGDAKTSSTESIGFADWKKLLEVESDKIWAWQISNILLIATLVLVGLILAMALLSFFVKNKNLQKANKFVSIITVVVAVLYLIFFVIGCFVQSYSGTIYSATFFPHFGAALLGLGALFAGMLLCAAENTKKKGKR